MAIADASRRSSRWLRSNTTQRGGAARAHRRHFTAEDKHSILERNHENCRAAVSVAILGLPIILPGIIRSKKDGYVQPHKSGAYPQIRHLTQRNRFTTGRT